jgi:gluconolactonase
MKQIAKEIRGAEGPVFDQAGRLFAVAPHVGEIVHVHEDGTVRSLANTGGIPAGLQIDADNHLWVADMKLGVLRVSPAGAIVQVVGEYDGKPIRGCNDCAFDTRGNLYFTAPAGSSADKPIGELFCRLSDGQVHRLDDGYAFSNGLAVNADDTMLIVAETYTKSLWAYTLNAPGIVSGKRLFGKLPGEHVGGPDGMDFDVEGNLLVANWGGGAIEVFDRNGKHIERITTLFQKPSNVHFGGADGCRLVITENGSHTIWETRWRCAGLWPTRSAPRVACVTATAHRQTVAAMEKQHSNG